MFLGSIPHDRLISAFERCVPDCYVRDYRGNDGYITICRGYMDIPWKGQLSTQKVYRTVPKETLMSMPRGNVTAASLFDGLRLIRPGWRIEIRKAMNKITHQQKKRITRMLGVGEVFPGVV